MRVLIPIFFNSPRGGLHEHVLASLSALRSAGHEVTVVSKPGPFAQSAENLGAATIATDWEPESLAMTIEASCDASPDVVYCHPFASRQLGVAVSEALGVPLIAVWHGMYDDFLPEYHDSIARIVVVSDGIGEYLVDKCPEVAGRLLTIPNGVGDEWRQQPIAKRDGHRVRIGFVCRLDDDKQFILDVVSQAVSGDFLAAREDLEWHIVGDGAGRAEFEESIATPSAQVVWHGWLNASDMRSVMSECDIIIAPGRSALEAMALGRPTIAVGSKHYAGIVAPQSWRAIAATNFGGIGSRFADYEPNRLASDLLSLIDNEDLRLELGEFSAALVNQEFRDSVSQARLLSTLGEVVTEGREPLPKLQVAFAQQRALALHLHEEGIRKQRRFSASWRETKAIHQAEVARLTEKLARRDAQIAKIKSNPLALMGILLRRKI
jgi:glycosyltransferase involved in cell wall biosynthesis